MNNYEFARIEKESITSKAYHHIRKSVLSGVFAPGTHLLEAQIAEQMGVSRSPIREAMRRLEAEGLVETKANLGAFVRKLTYRDVEEIYTARSLIEGFTVALAAKNASPESLADLEEALDQVLEAARNKDYQATLIADFNLHRLIWEIADHRILYNILARLEVQIRLFMAVQAPLFRELIDSVQDHSEIVRAIANGDERLAQETMERHINEAGTLTLAWLQQQLNENDSEQDEAPN